LPLWNREHLFARAAIVDPVLMASAPAKVTAESGFDVFTHAFESLINVNASPYVDMIALETIAIVAEFLLKVLKSPGDVAPRAKMAYADTLAGISISNVGTTLPHAMGQPISGHYPGVSHGGSLAAIYPAFLDYTYPSSVGKFAAVSRIFDSELKNESDDTAAKELSAVIKRFLKEIGIACSLGTLGVERNEIEAILSHCMEFPDVKVNPAVPDADDVRAMYEKSY
jgi:alcohol dehydrogenase class IV